MVAVYHIWFHRVSGGVDVFFVVAGYFASGSMLKAVAGSQAPERLRAVFQYWLRTARRVVPSAVTVIIGTVLAGILLIPSYHWKSTSHHGIASLGMFENWYLIKVESDYLQRGAASAFQQFWALSIQVQSYLLFPLIALSAAMIARVVGWQPQRMLLVISGIVLISSFGYSVHLTNLDQPTAYFHLGARFWEFMVGVVLALTTSKPIMGGRSAKVIGWAGLIAIVSFAAVVDPSPLLPGYVALVPVLGSMAVIVSSRHNAEPILLRSRPLLWFANSSFAFYLWHWPLYIIYKWQIAEQVSFIGGVGILSLAAVLAIATTSLVENPIRRSKKLVDSWIATVVVSSLLVGAAGGALLIWKRETKNLESLGWQQVTETIETGHAPPGVDYIPAPIIARSDLPQGAIIGCDQSSNQAEVLSCEWGDVSGAKTVVIVGGSHDLQWVDALDPLGAEHGVRVVSMVKSACAFGNMTNVDFEVEDACVEWATDALDKVIRLNPDLVVTMATKVGKTGEAFPEWKREYFQALADARIPVLGIRDNPRFSYDVPVCIELHGAENCSVQRADVFKSIEKLNVPDFPYFTFLDTSDDYCDAKSCPVVEDGILVYRDADHLSNTWVMLKGKRVPATVADLLGVA